jgi:16S rRNA processing protein RimM
MNQFLELGQIVNTKGLKGEVKVNPFTESLDRFESLDTILVQIKKENKEFKIEKVGYQKNQVILKLKGIDTVEEAEKLKNCYILISRDDVEPLPEGTYYIVDLIGLEVFTESGDRLGIVDDIYNTGSNDIYVVKDELGKQKLLPGIDEVIKEVNLNDKKIIVNLIDGLE